MKEKQRKKMKTHEVHTDTRGVNENTEWRKN